MFGPQPHIYFRPFYSKLGFAFPFAFILYFSYKRRLLVLFHNGAWARLLAGINWNGTIDFKLFKSF